MSELRNVLHFMEPGKPRRDLIKKHFEENPDYQLLVNKSGCLQTKKDKDLRYLIKKGYLQLIKITVSSKSRRSYLVKNNVKN